MKSTRIFQFFFTKKSILMVFHYWVQMFLYNIFQGPIHWGQRKRKRSIVQNQTVHYFVKVGKSMWTDHVPLMSLTRELALKLLRQWIPMDVCGVIFEKFYWATIMVLFLFPPFGLVDDHLSNDTNVNVKSLVNRLTYFFLRGEWIKSTFTQLY